MELWMVIAIVGVTLGMVGIANEFVKMRRYNAKRKEADDLARRAVDMLLMDKVDEAKEFAHQSDAAHQKALDILVGERD